MSIFHMTDILPLLGLPDPPPNRRAYYIACPRCDKGRDKHLNINLEKDVFNCPRCNFQGGIFDLYAYYTDIPRSGVYKELQARLSPGGEQLRFTGQSKKPKIEPVKEIALAPIEIRDGAFRALLSRLSLAADHEENLLNRGLTKEVIRRQGYKTTPVFGARALAKQLLSDGLTLAGVPGFYRDDENRWCYVSEQRGILIPVRDLQGRIQGLQIRRDNVTRRKFRWVSSSTRKDGCRSECWPHLAGPVRETIILTEGPLKADVIHHLTGHTVLAVPGVNALLQVEKVLRDLKELGVRKILTAFDMDFLRNFYVQSGYDKLTEILCVTGFQYKTMLWNPDYNGLDDYVWECLLNRGNPQQ